MPFDSVGPHHHHHIPPQYLPRPREQTKNMEIILSLSLLRHRDSSIQTQRMLRSLCISPGKLALSDQTHFFKSPKGKKLVRVKSSKLLEAAGTGNLVLTIFLKRIFQIGPFNSSNIWAIFKSPWHKFSHKSCQNIRQLFGLFSKMVFSGKNSCGHYLQRLEKLAFFVFQHLVALLIQIFIKLLNQKTIGIRLNSLI